LFGPSGDFHPAPAAKWWTRQNRGHFAYRCIERINELRDVTLAAARLCGIDPHFLVPLGNLVDHQAEFVRAAEETDDNGISGNVHVAYVNVVKQAEQVVELCNLLVDGAQAPVGYPNRERDKFIFDSRQAGKTWKQIEADVRRRKEWDPVGESGARQAMKAYIKRSRLSPPSRGKRGRPRKASAQ
jgi:hypothetical protein